MTYTPTLIERQLNGQVCALCTRTISHEPTDPNGRPIASNLAGARFSRDGRKVCGPCARAYLNGGDGA